MVPDQDSMHAKKTGDHMQRTHDIPWYSLSPLSQSLERNSNGIVELRGLVRSRESVNAVEESELALMYVQDCWRACCNRRLCSRDNVGMTSTSLI